MAGVEILGELVRGQYSRAWPLLSQDRQLEGGRLREIWSRADEFSTFLANI